MEKKELEKKLEGLMEEFKKYGVGSSSSVSNLASDPFFISDLDNESLDHLYSLLHTSHQMDMEKSKRETLKSEGIPQIPRCDSDKALQAETQMRGEYRKRVRAMPKHDDDLTKSFLDLADRFEKANPEEKTYEATTSEDAVDQHVHQIKALGKDGDGVTESAGSPAHTHNVSNFLVHTVEIKGYESEHPGKVTVKVGKSAFRITSEDEKGVEWEADFDIFKKDEDERLVGGIIYEPDVIDAQGDSASASEIKKACHGFMIKSMTLGEMHTKMIDKGKSYIVENFIAPADYNEGGQFIKRGSWVMVHKVACDEIWKSIKSGKYTGFSMAGRAKDISRKPGEFGKSDIPEPVKSVTASHLAILMKTDVSKRILQVGSEWHVYSTDGRRKVATLPDRESALKQLISMEANRHLTDKHIQETNEVFKAEAYYITAEKMGSVCTRCSTLMKKKGIHKIQVGTMMDQNKFKRMFGIRRSSIKHDGLCRKFCTDPGLFKDKLNKVGA